MSGQVENIGTARVYVVDRGRRLAGAQDTVDLIGETWGLDVAWIALPLETLPAGFLQLRTGIAGELIQKIVQYGLKVAIVGDVTGASADGTALRAFMTESNRGRHVWFVRDLDELKERLSV